MRAEEVAPFFTVSKEKETDRSILNRTTRNRVERPEDRVQETFPHGSALCDVKLKESEALRASADDLENVYHQCRATRNWALSNAVGRWSTSPRWSTRQHDGGSRRLRHWLLRARS